jgi:hypothetical protein
MFFRILRFYLKGFYETMLVYTNARLLSVGQRNSVSFNIHPSISNLTFLLQKEGVS